VAKQISFAVNKDLGYKRDAVIWFSTNYYSDAKKRPVLLDKLRAIPGISLLGPTLIDVPVGAFPSPWPFIFMPPVRGR